MRKILVNGHLESSTSYFIIFDNVKSAYWWYSKVEVKLATMVEGDPKAPFSIDSKPGWRRGRYSFP